MKKSIRILVLCLCACLLCSMIGTASAESGYVLYKGFFSNPESGSAYLGSNPLVVPTDTDTGKVLMVSYSSDKERAFISGKNASGQSEITCWTNIEFANGVSLIYAFCANWDDMSSLLDPGYSLALVLDFGGDDQIVISDAATAATFVTALDEYLAD